MYLVGDKVSYKYNGMSGTVIEVVDGNRVGVAWNTYDGRKITAIMAHDQIELVAGGDGAETNRALASAARATELAPA